VTAESKHVLTAVAEAAALATRANQHAAGSRWPEAQFAAWAVKSNRELLRASADAICLPKEDGIAALGQDVREQQTAPAKFRPTRNQRRHAACELTLKWKFLFT
jgi:hypothetical protein